MAILDLQPLYLHNVLSSGSRDSYHNSGGCLLPKPCCSAELAMLDMEIKVPHMKASLIVFSFYRCVGKTFSRFQEYSLLNNLLESCFIGNDCLLYRFLLSVSFYRFVGKTFYCFICLQGYSLLNNLLGS